MEENSAQQNVDSQPVITSHAPAKSSNMLLLGVGAVILLGLGLLGGYFLWGNKSSDLTQNLTPSPTLAAQKNVNQVNDETANWKTYTNTKHNYSIRYPIEYNLVKGPLSNEPESTFKTLDTVSFSGKGAVFAISVNPSDANGFPVNCSSDCLQKWLKVLNKSADEVVNLDGKFIGRTIQGFEYKNPEIKQTNRYFVFTQRNKVWVVSMTLNQYSEAEEDMLMQEFSRILSTFKFTDQNKVEEVSNTTTQVNGVDLNNIKHTLPQGWEGKISENSLLLSPIAGGGYLAIKVYSYSGTTGRKEYYCQISKVCIDSTYYTEMSLGNISGYMASSLDNSGGGNEYFGSKGNKFYIIQSFSPPSPNNFEENYKQVLNSLVF